MMVSIARLLRLGRPGATEEVTSDPGYQARRGTPSTTTESIPTWWRDNCGTNHRSYRTFAKCILGADEVHGDGQWAILPCWKRCGYPVHLYPTELSARKAEGAIDDTACRCRNHNHNQGGGHRIIRLGWPGRK